MSTNNNRVWGLFKRLFGAKEQPENKKEKIVKGLVKALDLTEEREMACEEVFEVIGQYAELVSQGERPEKVMPLVQHHLIMCGHCREEFEMLLEVIQIETA